MEEVGENKHNCELTSTLDGGLPKLRPGAGFFEKWKRKLQKQLVVSTRHPDCKFYFKSNAAITSEKKRQIRNSPYSIHPFSNVALFREVIMSLVWFFEFYTDPFFSAFYKPMSFKEDIWHHLNLFNIDLVLEICLLLNIVMCFFVGVMEEQTKKVELERKKIAIHYLSTFFIFDFVGTLPFIIVMEMMIKMISGDDKGRFPGFYTISYLVRVFRFARIKTAIRYFGRITSACGMSDVVHELLSLTIKSFFLVHWCACYNFLIQRALFHGVKYKFDESSWIHRSNISMYALQIDVPNAYFQSLRVTFCHFYGISMKGIVKEEPVDHIVFSIVMIVGYFFLAYLPARIFLIVKATYASQSKYEELLHEFVEYGNKKGVPVKMKNRVFEYLEHTYQKRYFQEKIILNTLSDRLRAELLLQDFKRLVEKVQMFQAFSKSTVGMLISHLRREVFLKNDIVFKLGPQCDAVRFISHGTVAFILENGMEIAHLHDGDIVGLLGLIINFDHCVGSVVALENCEMYRIDKQDLDYCIEQDETIYHVFFNMAKEKYRGLVTFLRDSSDKEESITRQLRKGKILEHQFHTRK
ncbi:hypothetical protein RI129_002067 [Pyrocoelia pectoralis]|uniref:Cyclic nucleotide-binding domain-containing protein n=1 Tax=Pyrocoelia pectoralis TaxID=417401 RepID=A0AAN7VF83_9COLE